MDYSDHQDPNLKDFRNFLFLVWRFLSLPKPTEAQYAIADRLQHGPKRDIIMAFRGVGKSYITAAFCLWTLYWDPNKKIQVVSASHDLAANFTKFCLSILNGMPELEWLRPTEDQRSSQLQFDVGPCTPAKDPSVKSSGITGQITGTRADLVIPDDIEVPKNSATEVQRQKISELVKEFDAILKPGGDIKYLGTPQTEMSLYNKLEERGYAHFILPSRYPMENERTYFGSRLANYLAVKLDNQPSLAGRPTDPFRFSDEDLLTRAASYGRSGYQLQFQLNTSLTDANKHPLKISDLIVMSMDNLKAPGKLVWGSGPDQIINDLPNLALKGDYYNRPIFVSKEWSDYTGKVMAIDPSGRGKDETAYAVTCMMNSQIFVPACGGFHGGYTKETLEALAHIAKRENVKHVLVESNFGDGMFTELLKPIFSKIHSVSIEEVKHNKQKELRIIDVLEPVLNQHRLVIDPRVIQQDWESLDKIQGDHAIYYSLIYQLTRLTRERGSLPQDDRLDALAMAVAYWSAHLALTVEDAYEDLKQRRLDEELEKFMDNCLGSPRNKSRQNSWIRLP